MNKVTKTVPIERSKKGEPRAARLFYAAAEDLANKRRDLATSSLSIYLSASSVSLGTKQEEKQKS
jgi:hypothetical protein